MTITVNFSTVADSISNLSISGVTVKDMDAIPDNADLLGPLLFPEPTNFITDLQVTRMSFGGGGTAKMDMTYTMNYVYLHCAANGNISAYAAYSGLITKLATIVIAILTNDNISGPVDFEMNTIPAIGIVEDPAGTPYFGALLAFRVTEHAQ